MVTGERCEVTASGTTFEWAPDQASNAAAITAIAVQRDLPPRAATIAVATAMQESKVRNVRFGDRDSLGLFQQRPSQGWGTAEQILDPEYSTNRFYDALVEVDGYTDMDIAEAAQAVQRSAAGEAYAQHESQARVTASALSGQTAAGIGCALDDPTDPVTPRSWRRCSRRTSASRRRSTTARSPSTPAARSWRGPSARGRSPVPPTPAPPAPSSATASGCARWRSRPSAGAPPTPGPGTRSGSSIHL